MTLYEHAHFTFRIGESTGAEEGRVAFAEGLDITPIERY
jgi:hypothetical protein